VTRDWLQWHEQYEVPGSSLARRLEVVRGNLRPLLDRPRRVISMCAGDGRDVLPLLPPGSRAVLVESDPVLAGRARAAAGEGVTVLTGDAGVTDPYVSVAPAEVLLACGVFGNIPDEDTRRTIASLPSLLAPGGTVIWTRAGQSDVREVFGRNGFTELAFEAPADARFRVGVHRLTRDPDPYESGVRLFRFV
jgi:hypothetical protein